MQISGILDGALDMCRMMHSHQLVNQKKTERKETLIWAPKHLLIQSYHHHSTESLMLSHITDFPRIAQA